MNIILASSSPRRKELIKLITENYSVMPADVDETVPEDVQICKASAYLAELKAVSIAEKCPEAVVIGCDTTVICNGEILGKPADIEQCRRFMNMLSGTTHQVITGCSIVKGLKKSTFSVSTDVTFRKLNDDEIEKYIHSEEPYDKAGGYGIQGHGALLIEKINGDYFNVVGLPVSRLNCELKKFI